MPVTQNTNDASGIDLQKLLQQVLNPNGPGGGTIPLTQNAPHIPMAPLIPKERANIQTANQEFGTKSGNRRIAQNNMFSNMAEIIKTADKNHEMQKMRTLSMDIERLLVAAQNPQDPQNKEVINALLSDPKKRKEISKALDINFMEDKRDPKYKGALDMAVSNVKKGQQPNQQQEQQGQRPDFASQLQKQMPQVQTLSPQLQVMMGLMKNLSPYFQALTRKEGQLGAANSLAQSREAVAKIQATSRDYSTNIKALSDKYKADAGLMGRVYAADKHLDGVLKMAEAHAKLAKEADGMKRLTMLKDIDELARNGIKDTQTGLLAAMQQMGYNPTSTNSAEASAFYNQARSKPDSKEAQTLKFYTDIMSTYRRDLRFIQSNVNALAQGAFNVPIGVNPASGLPTRPDQSQSNGNQGTNGQTSNPGDPSGFISNYDQLLLGQGYSAASEGDDGSGEEPDEQP